MKELSNRIGRAYQVDENTFFYIERICDSGYPWGICLGTSGGGSLTHRYMDETSIIEIPVADFLKKMAETMNKITIGVAKKHLIDHLGIWGFEDK